MLNSKKNDNYSISSNMFYALGSQLISLLISILTSLILPKYLGVVDYGFYQLFIFYTTYVGFALFGLNDGIYLKFGGKKYEDLDKELLKIQYLYSLCFQLIIIIIIIPFLCLKDNTLDRFNIYIFTAIYMLISNTYGYFAFIFQAINWIKIYSISIMIERFFYAFFLLISLFFNIKFFEIYIIIVIISKFIAMIYCLLYSKEIVLIKTNRWKIGLKEMFSNMKIGINLMLANIASMLILGISRFLIDSNWGIEAFAKFSFSLSLANFFLMFINQVSMVLFPALKRINIENQKQIFDKINKILFIIMPFVYLAYLPLGVFVNLWLPQYSESVMYLAIILPICVFDGKMNLLYSTYFKMFRLEKQLLYINLITVCISCALALFGIYIINNIIFVIVGIVVSIICRSLISYLILSKYIDNTSGKMNIFIEVVMAFIFIILNLIKMYIFSFILIFVIEIIILYKNRKFISENLRINK